MKIENLRLGHIVHAYGVLALLSAMALFAYEIAKPDIEGPARGTAQAKLSALATPPVGATVLYQFQPPSRAGRKGHAYHAARYKAKPTGHPQKDSPAEVSGNQ